MIYRKLSFTNPERVRYHQVFEYVFILSKGEPRCFNPIKDRSNIWAGKTSFGKSTFRQVDGTTIPRPNNPVYADFGMRHNVWDGKTRGQEQICTGQSHPAKMPMWLARDLIISWSNEKDTVLDPFAGSFTTCIEAEQIGRKAIGIDISEEYCDLGRKAIIKPQQFEFYP